MLPEFTLPIAASTLIINTLNSLETTEKEGERREIILYLITKLLLSDAGVSPWLATCRSYTGLLGDGTVS